MNNNIIPACIIGAGLFAVALKPAPQPAPIPQAEPVAVAAASFTGPSEPVIVWYSTIENAWDNGVERGPALLRAWSDGTIEAKLYKPFVFATDSGNCEIIIQGDGCEVLTSDWITISSAQMACRTDINGDGSVELGDLLAVLSQWGDQATCPDTVQLQCGLGLPNG